MTQLDFLSEEIAKRYGTVKRARGSFLYTEKGVRLTDLYQEGGRAILGWGGNSAFTQFKNVLSRGITGSFPTDFSYRLQKAVSELLASTRKVFVFHTKEAALHAVRSCLSKDACVWKPWTDGSVAWSSEDFVVVEPPLPWSGGISILAVRSDALTDCFSDALEHMDVPFRSVVVPAPLLAAMTRSVYNMIAAVQEREEKHWFVYDSVLAKYWTRKGPYLYPKVDMDKYNDFILHCLDQGIVISPFYDVPSIVPFGVDRGVFTKLKNRSFLCQDKEIH